MRSKRLIALMLTIVMALAMTATAFASAEMGETGEIGNFAPGGDVSTINAQEKTVVIYKQLVAYNPESLDVNAPTITYSYTIAPATVGSYTVIDGQNPAVTADVKAGKGTPGITASVALTNATPLETASAGKENVFPITIDFSSVVFESAGVYRYEITETVEGIAATGITAGTSARKRYMDVYVKAKDDCGDGTAAADWDIYGYTCFVVNGSIEATTKASAAKTIGFGSYTLGSTDYTADSYYTYNLQIGKTVDGDSYAEKNIAFPFTVIFTNAAVTGSIDISSSVSDAAKVGGFTDPAAAALSAGTTKGVAEIKSGATVKYIGIPCGTDVEVYETNIATGVTYEVTTTLSTSSAAATPETVTAGSKPTTAVAQAATKEAYQSTKSVVDTTADAKQDNLITISITNKYLTISPTGVIVRYAPYALVLICGILLLLLGWKFLRRKETA